MIGTKGIAILMALGVGLLAGLGGLYLYQSGQGLPFGAGPETATTGDGSPASPSSPQAAAPAETAPDAQAEASAGAKPDAEPTTVPSFDVVMIEPNGEGVIAGRAAPGWQVSVQAGGAKVAAATADAQGEWSAVLDKPLPAGDHALTLKITSPDGTRALSSQELVRVEVGDAAKPAPPSTTAAITPPAPPPAAPPSAETAAISPPPPAAPPSAPAPSAEPGAAPSQPPLALAEPQGEARAVPRTGGEGPVAQPAKPKLVFKTVDYQDTGSAIGSVSITGTADPGATVTVYCNNEKLATVRAGADGTWSVVAEKKLGTGQHSFRAEQIDAATGTALAQANVAIERLVPKPPEVVAKAATPKPGSPAASVAAAEDKEVYTIRRGDTLWAIAKRYLGSGLRYTSIFQSNREVINDPDLILPQQQVKVPPAQD